MNLEELYYQLVQYGTLIYYLIILPYLMFFKKGKLLTTDEFLKTFWTL